MAFGSAVEGNTDPVPRLSRVLSPDEWESFAVPLLRNPREVVKELHARHLPSPATAVIAVFAPDGRIVASASFTQRAACCDGWQHRNAILAHLRQVIPHDLRRRTPVRTALLLVCREGVPEWTEADGAWMWGLRDACSLHGLRCGAYVTLTPDGWHVLGDGRTGRTPHSGSWSEHPPRNAAVAPEPLVHEAVPQAVRRQAAR